jgi:hypothetical protein
MDELRPWFAVARPHEDVRKGRLSKDVFAANLWAVVQDRAPDVYTDPETFFQKTYLTEGLKRVLRLVGQALAGTGTGDRILNLQTGFGGGKTHILVALWHLAKHADVIRTSGACADVREALGKHLLENVRAVAVFTNETCDAVQGRQTPEGVHTRTLWGELALQLGGVELYRRVEPNDQARTVPQGIFVDILREAAPCLILIDELADYCVGAAAVQAGNTTLADQTISFLQHLTQAVQQVPQTALVATLPASHLEVASTELGQQILDRLERRFKRLAADVQPISDEELEIYEVVRRRLFEPLEEGMEEERRRTIEAYWQLYQAHRNELPPETTRGGYRDRMLKAYPFHPELIDAFHLRWASHDEFQRARGVLTMLAAVVNDLWQRRHTETQSQSLIQPAHLRWTLDMLHGELTRLWGQGYEAVVDGDVIGEKANATLIDEERGGEYARERVTQGLAAAILLGSFGGQGERAGYSSKELKLSVARPTFNWNCIDGALLAFEDRAHYLYPAAAGSLGKRYRFLPKPRFKKLVERYRRQYERQPFSEEIVELLQRQIDEAKRRSSGLPWQVLLDPGPHLPEQRTLTLVVLPPEAAHPENGDGESPAVPRIRERSEKCSQKDRRYRNTLLFLVPSERGIRRLRQYLRDQKALEDVRRDYGDQLDAEQRQELEEEVKQTQEKVLEALAAAYAYIGRIEGAEVLLEALPNVSPGSFAERLAGAWHYVVEQADWVVQRVGAVTLREAGLIPKSPEEALRVKEALEAFLRYTDKPMLASPQALLEGLVRACEDRVIGLGRGAGPQELQRRWCGERVTLEINEEDLWILPSFESEPPPAPAATATPQPSERLGDASPGAATAEPPQPTPAEGAATVPRQPVRRIRIRGAVPLESWSDVFRSFVSPSARLNPKRLRLGVDFEIEASEERPLDAEDPALKRMQEAAEQLGLEFEVEQGPEGSELDEGSDADSNSGNSR